MLKSGDTNEQIRIGAIFLTLTFNLQIFHELWIHAYVATVYVPVSRSCISIKRYHEANILIKRPTR